MQARGCVFVTGSTGFVGHYVLASLLRRGQRCVAMVRPGNAERLLSLLGEIDAPATDDRLAIIEGALPDGLPGSISKDVRALVHVAGVTRFGKDLAGEPIRTNVEGTRELLAWTTTHRVRDFHFVSTAYACGRRTGRVPERIEREHSGFHNAYEESKWEAERLCAAWAERGGGNLTIYRPSIVVGQWDTGRTTQFRGFYLLARATELLAQSVAEACPAKRHDVNLRIPGRAEGRIDLVPVDFVADAIAHMVASKRHQAGVYHLTHPNPVTNGQIKQWLEDYFDIGGGRFVGDANPPDGRIDEFGRLFHQAVRSTVPYWTDSPVFAHDRTDQALLGSGIRCPDFDESCVSRLVKYAQRARWGRTRSRMELHDSGEDYARYFERFLPDRVGRSHVAATTAVSTTMRFIIQDVANGQWTCRFERGQLAEVRRGANTLAETFGYRAPKRVFWKAISGRVRPEELFFEDGVEVFGDVERALKMAAILHEFTKEFPCDQQRLANC